MKVYLDIDIGDRSSYESELGAYQVTESYFKQVGQQYGFSGDLDQLDADGKEVLREAFEADPGWSAKGAYRADRPADIRAGRLVIELENKEVPRTCENFRALCTGERGVGKASKKPLHLQGCGFHRIVKGFCCQGWDIVRGDGSGGDSIYGGKFNDEKPGLKLKHDAAGVVSMANSGKNSNTSQFFLTLAAAPQCDGKHVVFGHVVEGLDILMQLDEEAASADGTPRVNVTIAGCGVLS